MPTVRVSPKYQVVISLEVRERLGVRSGQEMRVFTHGNRIELVPVRPLRELRGFLRGIDTEVPREDDRV